MAYNLKGILGTSSPLILCDTKNYCNRPNPVFCPDIKSQPRPPRPTHPSNMASASSTSQAPDLPTSYGNLRDLLPSHWITDVTHWLAEDTPSFDYGGFVVGSSPRTAELLCKSPGVLAGQPFVEEIFRQLDCEVQWENGFKDGDFIDPKGGKIKVASVSGPTRKLLLGERVALNTLARCSGVATKSRRVLELTRKAGYKGYHCREQGRQRRGFG